MAIKLPAAAGAGAEADSACSPADTCTCARVVAGGGVGTIARRTCARVAHTCPARNQLRRSIRRCCQICQNLPATRSLAAPTASKSAAAAAAAARLCAQMGPLCKVVCGNGNGGGGASRVDANGLRRARPLRGFASRGCRRARRVASAWAAPPPLRRPPEQRQMSRARRSHLPHRTAGKCLKTRASDPFVVRRRRPHPMRACAMRTAQQLAAGQPTGRRLISAPVADRRARATQNHRPLVLPMARGVRCAPDANEPSERFQFAACSLQLAAI